MAREECGDTSGSDGDHGRNCSGGGAVREGEGGGGESVSGVTEVGSSGNAAKAERGGKGGLDDGGEDWLSTVTTEREKELGTSDGAQEKTSTGEAASPVRLLAAKLGWLLLGFLAGAAVAAAVLFLKRARYPEISTVPT